MYTPPRHAAPSRAAMLDLIDAQPFGLLVSTSGSLASADHLPFVLDRERECLLAHVARANPLAARLHNGMPMLAVFQGPAHYISPAWMASKAEHGRVVPTWNYQAVQVRGALRLVQEPAALTALLDRLTAAQEHPLHGAGHWRSSDAPPGYMALMQQHILAFELPLTELQGRWKLTQGNTPADRESILQGLRALATPAALAMVAALESLV